ncbi:MAG TPA: CopD family protein [Alphaproteobacteria bacterium]|nr:CopD family protein [Alphaproteobacteria bacterium]
MTTEFLVLTRAIHFAACLLFFGICAFDQLIAAPILASHKIEAADFWKSRIRNFSLILLPLILISGIGWFVLVAMTMSGQPPHFEILRTVWQQTQFGMVWKIRLIIWLAATVAAMIFCLPKLQPSLRKKLIWLELLFGGALLASLAWAGHGQEDSHWHLFADLLHLLVAGLWPTGLLPFALLLRKLRRTSEPAIAPLVRRFSTMSLVSVSLLAATGLVNSWFLVGSFSNLFSQTYGRWLVAKITLFCLAVTIGAVNLLRLKPRLSLKNLQSGSTQAAAQLQCNVHIELFLGMAIVIVVAVLGILPPANH